jgi:hypothetical protein
VSITLDETAPSGGHLTATPSGSDMNLSWNSFTDNTGGSGMASFLVVYSTVGTVTTCTPGGNVNFLAENPLATTTFQQTGIVSGTTYYYGVCGIDAVGNVSAPATATAVGL